MSIPHHSTNADQLVELLRAGVLQQQAAAALGITASAVTQLIASPEVSAQQTNLREEQAKRSTAIDEKYDRLEAVIEAADPDFRELLGDLFARMSIRIVSAMGTHKTQAARKEHEAMMESAIGEAVLEAFDRIEERVVLMFGPKGT